MHHEVREDARERANDGRRESLAVAPWPDLPCRPEFVRPPSHELGPCGYSESPVLHGVSFLVFPPLYCCAAQIHPALKRAKHDDARIQPNPPIARERDRAVPVSNVRKRQVVVVIVGIDILEGWGLKSWIAGVKDMHSPLRIQALESGYARRRKIGYAVGRKPEGEDVLRHVVVRVDGYWGGLRHGAGDLS